MKGKISNVGSCHKGGRVLRLVVEMMNVFGKENSREFNVFRGAFITPGFSKCLMI